jgi:hypothetical protein
LYTIVRHIGGRTIEVAATEATAVEPGDTLKVELPLPIQTQVESAATVRDDRPVPAWPANPPPALRGARTGEMPIRY